MKSRALNFILNNSFNIGCILGATGVAEMSYKAGQRTARRYPSYASMENNDEGLINAKNTRFQIPLFYGAVFSFMRLPHIGFAGGLAIHLMVFEPYIQGASSYFKNKDATITPPTNSVDAPKSAKPVAKEIN
jgi:hypothetical protein